MSKQERSRQAPAPIPRGKGAPAQDQSSEHPICGRVYQIITAGGGAGDAIRELKLVRKTELTYSWCDPDDDPFHPVLIHVLIRDCTIVAQVPKDWQTRMHGVPVAFYDRRVARGPLKPKPVVTWSFDPQPYIEADLERQKRRQQGTTEQEAKDS